MVNVALYDEWKYEKKNAYSVEFPCLDKDFYKHPWQNRPCWYR